TELAARKGLLKMSYSPTKRGFLSQKGSGVGRGVKEKNIEVVKDGVVPSVIVDSGNAVKEVVSPSDGSRNDVGPVGDTSIIMEGVTPSMIDMTVEKEKRSSLEDTTILGSFFTITYAYKNLLKEDVSTVPVWVKLHGVPVTTFSEDGLSAIATKLGTLLMLDSYTSDMYMQSWGRSSYARVMIELRADVELKDNIVVAMPKITKEGHYICNVRVEYEWKPPRCLSCMVFGHIHEECPKNIGAGEKKTVKKPSQTSRGVPVGPKIGFKPQKEYQHVTKMPNASSSGNKKKSVEPTIEVSNSNLFDVFNSVDNDVEFGTNASNTPIGEKIDKIE
ncbi:RNA-directed DNA polymerase, eukaryota, reverse transcriptase zinc-binding domain protein, partial [Tanacetum coccineum]